MQDQTIQPQSARSNFITVLAWIFIVLAGFITLISILQNIMISAMPPFDKMQAQAGNSAQKMPAFLSFMTNHMHLFFLAFLVVSGATLISAIGLLHRKNWARLTFVAILALGILWNVGGLIMQQAMFSSMSTLPSNAPPDFSVEFDQITSVIRVFSIIFALGFCVLFGWLIKRLLSNSIRAEFVGAA